jgi:hypothetical protein
MARPGTFTTETARKAAQASVHARKVAADYFAARPIVQPTPPTVAPTVQPSDEFQSRRLKRVRDQLSRIDTELETCPLKDSKRLKELADASARLSDQEFKLAGRPSPGSRRPAQERAPSTQDAGAWIVEAKPACGSDTTTGSVQPAQPEASTPQDPMGQEGGMDPAWVDRKAKVRRLYLLT